MDLSTRFSVINSPPPIDPNDGIDTVDSAALRLIFMDPPTLVSCGNTRLVSELPSMLSSPVITQISVNVSPDIVALTSMSPSIVRQDVESVALGQAASRKISIKETKKARLWGISNSTEKSEATLRCECAVKSSDRALPGRHCRNRQLRVQEKNGFRRDSFERNCTNPLDRFCRWLNSTSL